MSNLITNTYIYLYADDNVLLSMGNYADFVRQNIHYDLSKIVKKKLSLNIKKLTNVYCLVLELSLKIQDVID